MPAPSTALSAHGRAFRLAAIAEACSWAGLLVGMFFKYVVVGDDIGVKIFGPVHGALFCEPSPAPTKWALARMGRIPSAHARLPIVPLTADGERTVESALQASELL